MIHVWFDPATGDILHTATLGDSIDPDRLGVHRLTAEAPLGDPALWQVEGGVLMRRTDVSAAIRAAALERVNRWRGEARRPFITVLPGQDMVYLDKERQALALVADPDPDPEAYPGLAAELGITAPTLWEVAQVILNLAALWRSDSAAIEAAALGAIADINAATTVAEIEAALQQLEGIEVGDGPGEEDAE